MKRNSITLIPAINKFIEAGSGVAAEFRIGVGGIDLGLLTG